LAASIFYHFFTPLKSFFENIFFVADFRDFRKSSIFAAVKNDIQLGNKISVEFEIRERKT